MRRKDVEAAETTWIDDRLAGESKAHKSPRGSGYSPRSIAQLIALAVVCWTIGVHEMIFAAFTRVHCTPLLVRAGSNASCIVQRSILSSDNGLTITQVGTAGTIMMMDEQSTSYHVSFTTRASGAAGVRVTHAWFWHTAWVEVIPAPAVAVDVACRPQQVPPGADVRCAVTPRDAFGNPGAVEKPMAVSAKFFSVSAIGSASQLAVHDEYVSFVAGDQVGSRAGIVVTLAGKPVESSVQIT